MKSSVKLFHNKVLPLKTRICRNFLCKNYFVYLTAIWDCIYAKEARPQLPEWALVILVVTQEGQMHEKRCAGLQVHLDSWGSLSNKSCVTILHPQTAQGELQMSESQWNLFLQRVRGLRHFCICRTAKFTCKITQFPGAANTFIQKHLLQEKMIVQSQISLSILPQFNRNFMFSLENQQTV